MARQEMLVTIEPDGVTRVKVINEEPGHAVQLIPFQNALSNGNPYLVESHTHDHGHQGEHIHAAGGGPK